MARQYTKMEIISEEVFRRKAAGESNKQIAESYGLTTYGNYKDPSYQGKSESGP